VDYQIELKDDMAFIRVTGELTISYSSELKQALLEAVGSSDRIVLDMDGAEAVDLPCIELLCSAHRTSISAGKAFGITGNSFSKLRPIMMESGFERHRGCVLDSNKSCIWAYTPDVAVMQH